MFLCEIPTKEEKYLKKLYFYIKISSLQNILLFLQSFGRFLSIKLHVQKVSKT